MKLVSIAALLVFASFSALVGCSHKVTTTETDAADTTEKPAVGDSNVPASTPAPAIADAGAPATETDADASSSITVTVSTSDPNAQACLSCMVGKDPEVQAVVDCDRSCVAGDDDCSKQCWTTTCGGSLTGACVQAYNSCAPCAGNAAVDTAEKNFEACEACFANLNPKLGVMAQCIATCDDPTSKECADQCAVQSGCTSDAACLAAASTATDSCAAQCSQ